VRAAATTTFFSSVVQKIRSLPGIDLAFPRQAATTAIGKASHSRAMARFTALTTASSVAVTMFELAVDRVYERGEVLAVVRSITSAFIAPPRKLHPFAASDMRSFIPRLPSRAIP